MSPRMRSIRQGNVLVSLPYILYRRETQVIFLRQPIMPSYSNKSCKMSHKSRSSTNSRLTLSGFGIIRQTRILLTVLPDIKHLQTFWENLFQLALYSSQIFKDRRIALSYVPNSILPEFLGL